MYFSTISNAISYFLKLCLTGVGWLFIERHLLSKTPIIDFTFFPQILLQIQFFNKAVYIEFAMKTRNACERFLPVHVNRGMLYRGVGQRYAMPIVYSAIYKT